MGCNFDLAAWDYEVDKAHRRDERTIWQLHADWVPLWVKLWWKMALAQEEISGAAVGECNDELFWSDFEGWG